MTDPSESTREWTAVGALGLLTITSYGSWFYAFGVLLEPITADTGWSTTVLGVTYGLAQVLTGIGSFVGGRLLDRFDVRGPFLLQAVGGAGLMALSSLMTSPWLFGVSYAVGAGIIGGTGFYNVTTAAAGRLHPDAPDRAIARLTIWGAFASPIYLPATAWLVTHWDWRPTIQLLAAISAVAALLASVVARGAASATSTGPSADPIAAMRAAVRRPVIRRMLLVYVLGGLAFSSVLVYQVPILTGAGLSLAVAGTIAGLRGFCQIFGRIGLTPLVDRFGSRALLRVAYGGAALGVLMLLIGTLPGGIAYAVVAGATLGASSPLQAMYSRASFDEADLGLLMGMQGASIGIAGGLGPFVGGLAHDLTGSWIPIVMLSVVALLAASTMLVDGDPSEVR